MLIRRTIYLCRKNLLVNTVTLLAVFLMFGLSMAELALSQYYLSNTDFLDNEFYLVPNKLYDVDVATMVKGTINITDCGEVSGWYVNQVYCDNFVRLESGRGLDYRNSSEILLCGEQLRKKYDINDEITINDKIYKVVGVLTPECGLVDLSFRYDTKDYVSWIDNLYDIRKAELIISNDITAFSENSISGLSNISFEEMDGAISFKDICRNTRNEIKQRNFFTETLMLVLFCFSLYNIISNKITEILTFGNYYSIYALCGMSKWRRIFMSLLVNLMYVVTAFGVYYCIFATVIHHNALAYDAKSTLLPCFGMAMLVVVLSVIFDVGKKE